MQKFFESVLLPITINTYQSSIRRMCDFRKVNKRKSIIALEYIAKVNNFMSMGIEGLTTSMQLDK